VRTTPENHPGPTVVCGVGIDAVDVERFRALVGRRPRVVDRLFTDNELSYASRTPDPGPRLAGRFAAKEAILKALGAGIGACDFREMEVVRSDAGQPQVALAGRAARLAHERGIGRLHLSITHTDALAVASVVAVGGEPAEGPFAQETGRQVRPE